MKKIFFTLTFLPILSFGQANPENSILIPARLKLKPVLDSINYIDSKQRFAIINYLKTNKLDPANYFIDSVTQKTGDTLYIQVWDIVGIQTINRYERKKDSLETVQANSKGKKLRAVLPNGNPGNCFTVTFDLIKNEIIEAGFGQ